jgi:hypothetical protein
MFDQLDTKSKILIGVYVVLVVIYFILLYATQLLGTPSWWKILLGVFVPAIVLILVYGVTKDTPYQFEQVELETESDL